MSIPASEIVSIVPGVIGAGGNPLALNAMFITKNIPSAMSSIQAFTNPDAVSDVFGLTSTEYKAAQVYFAGFNNCTTLPDTLYFAAMTDNAQPAKLVGSRLSPPTDDTFTDLPVGFQISINGTQKSVTISNDVTSYSDLAVAVTSSLDKAATCSFDAVSSSFVITTSEASSESTITTATGNLAEFMGLTSAKGARSSNGSDSNTAATIMPSIYSKVTNFATIMCVGDFSAQELLTISAWVTKQNNRFAHIIYRDGDISGDVTTISNGVLGSEMSGTLMIYGDFTHGAFACAYAASLNFNELNGRTNFAFRKQAGITPSVSDSQKAAQLRALGFNYYGAYATANDNFVFVYAGGISGDFKWFDSYINQIYFNAQFQLAMMTMLTSYKLIPYNAVGKAIHRSACQDVINQMKNFGALQAGVDLSEQQKTQINIEAGYDAASQLQTTGYALLIGKATAQVRGNRGSLPMKFWYADGGSVQAVNLPSINVQ